MGNWKAAIPIIAALVVAVAGSVALHKWMKTQSSPGEVVEVKTESVPVVVATIELSGGMKITSEMLKTAQFYKESLPSGYFMTPEKIVGRIVIAPIKTGEPVAEHRLAPDSIKTGGVAAVLKHGKRAIAVKGDKVIGISGFINPGNHVDVLVTFTDPRSKKQKTKLVLENILVMATGTQIQNNDKGEPAPVDVYTLEVTPEEGEKLALVASEGKLQFALRNMMDTEKVLTRGATIPQTLASLTRAEAVTPKSKVKRYPRTIVTEVIKGSTVTHKRMKI
jgi:pilus assembly protein CpaB